MNLASCQTVLFLIAFAAFVIVVAIAFGIFMLHMLEKHDYEKEFLEEYKDEMLLTFFNVWRDYGTNFEDKEHVLDTLADEIEVQLRNRK